MAIRASYLHELQEQGSLNEAIAKRLLAKGMSVADVAEAMQMPEESVAKLQKNRKNYRMHQFTIKSLNVII